MAKKAKAKAEKAEKAKTKKGKGKAKTPSAKAGKGKGKAKTPAAKKPAPKKGPVAKTKFGHREGTLAAVMDNLLAKGTTLQDASEAMAEFKGGDATAQSCMRQLKVHMKYLENKKGAKMKVNEKEGTYKAILPKAKK